MGTLNEDLTGIKAVEDKLTANKVAKFAYTDHAYNNPLTEADGVTVYNVNNEQNIPVADATILNVNETVLTKGWRSQASAITRMLMNHFLGRISYNLNKVNDNVSSMLATFISHLGTANGIATLDANGRIPFAQLPESAIEYEGNWNADTNTPHLVNGTGTKGDFYTCNVAGTCDFGAGAISFLENDRVIYDGTVWSKLSAGDVRTVNGVAPDSSTGNVQLTKGDIGLSSVVNTGDSANVSSGGTTKFTTGGAYNLLTSLAPIFSSSTAYAVGKFVTYQNTLYECTTAHSAGAWNTSHFTARSVEYIINTYIFPSLAPAFSTSTAYAVGNFVIYQNKLYRCIATHSAGAWNTSHFSLATLNDALSVTNASGTLPIAHGGTGKTTATDAINNFINSLSTGDATPQDADYYIAQYAGGGTTNNTYVRRNVSALWNYIKSKITGAISSVITSDLTANRMVVTDANGKMTVASRIGVTGVKGNSETSYRTGDVNITKSNIGLGSVANTGDSASPASGGNTKFTTGGAYNFFGGNTSASSWLGKVFSWSLLRNFTTVKSNFVGSNHSIVYANGLVVAGNSNGGISWSADKGSSWTQGTGISSTLSVESVFYTNSLWLACTTSGIWWSTDGKAWTQGTGSNTTFTFTYVAYNNGIYVACSTSHGLWWSTNGKAWTQSTSSITSLTFTKVYFGASLWQACSTTSGIWWSTDGKTWTQGTGSIAGTNLSSIQVNDVLCVSEANSVFLAGTGKGLVGSVDGKAWFKAVSNEALDNVPVNIVVFLNGVYFIGTASTSIFGNGKGIWYATSVSWTTGASSSVTISLAQTDAGSELSVSSVVFDNNTFVATTKLLSKPVGILISKNGVNWEQSLFTSSESLKPIYVEGAWLVNIGTNLRKSSVDNIAWQ